MSNNQTLIAQCEEKARQWLSPAFDEETRSAVEAMINNDDKADLIESFYKDLEPAPIIPRSPPVPNSKSL